jgi:Ca-activated chloride channel family protein
VRPLVLLAAASVLCAGAAAQEDPGTGALVAETASGRVELPIVDLTVDLEVNGTSVRGTIEQRFVNPGGEAIDGTYVFPLPEGAAVDYLSLSVDGRSWVGEIQEKEEARRTFERAKVGGKRAGLVEQHRPNIFRTSVANIPAGSEVSVTLSFLDEADWQDGVFTTAFPLTITPRYKPGETDPVCSASVPNATVRALLEPGFPVEWVRSPSHVLTRPSNAPEVSVATGGPADRDFVLRWKPVSASAPFAGGVVEDREDGRYLSVTVLPPDLGDDASRTLPTQTVFVVDVSGSMEGPSILRAREALLAALDRLRPEDSFAMIRFNDGFESYHGRFEPARPAELAAARAWVEGLRAGGGTEILPALLEALAQSARGDPRALQRVVLITDGAVGNEEEVLEAVEGSLGETRLHVVGIGAAPNRWLMQKLARSGRGVAEFVGSVDEVKERIDALLTRTERAVVGDLAVLGVDAADLDLAGRRIPDLYAGRPLTITARLAPGRTIPKLSVWGRARGGPVTIDLPVVEAKEGSGAATRWARARIEALEDSKRAGADPAVVRTDVVDLAKRFSLVTAYTSFVVVEEESEEEHCCCSREGLDELPAGGTEEPLLFALGVLLPLGGLVVIGVLRLTRGGIA